MSNARIHTRNLLANWTGHGANMLVLFFLSPFVVHTIGPAEYGIWSLLTVLTGYMGLFDIGVRSSTGRYIVYYLGRGDHQRVDETIRTGLGFFSIIGCVILVGGVVVGWLFPTFFPSVPEKYHGLVLGLLPVLALGIWCSALEAVFSSVLTGHDRFDLMRSVDLVALALRAVGTVVALKCGFGLIGLTAVALVCHLVGVGGNWWLARRIYPQLKVWPFSLARARLKELLSYGLAAFVGRASLRVIGQTSLVVVGAIISVAAVTTYAVGSMLVLYGWPFVDMIGTTLFPALQRASARGDVETERWYYLRQIRIAELVGLPVYVGFIVFGQAFIGLWMGGPDFDDTAVGQAATVMVVLSLSRLCALHTFAALSLLWARGHVWFAVGGTAVEAVVNLGLGVLLVLRYHMGMYGIALGALAAMVVVRGIVIPWRGNRLAGLRWRRFIGLMAAALAAGGAFAGWCLLVRHVLPPDSWRTFAADVALALAGYVPLSLVLLVPPNDRKRVFAWIGGWVGRRA